MKWIVILILAVTCQTNRLIHNFHEKYQAFTDWRQSTNKVYPDKLTQSQGFLEFLMGIENTKQPPKNTTFQEEMFASTIRRHHNLAFWNPQTYPKVSTIFGDILMVDRKVQVPKEYRLLTYEEAQVVKSELYKIVFEWGMASLENGKVYGYGYGGQLTFGHCIECGEKLLIRI